MGLTPNFDKLNLGRTIEARHATPSSSVCHNYGILNGCDEGCPALLNGECEVPFEAIENCDVTDEERDEILKLYLKRRYMCVKKIPKSKTFGVKDEWQVSKSFRTEILNKEIKR